jgi:hypothetical protein
MTCTGVHKEVAPHLVVVGQDGTDEEMIESVTEDVLDGKKCGVAYAYMINQTVSCGGSAGACAGMRMHGA